jgi:phosphoribosylformylglycinamidine synthase I
MVKKAAVLKAPGTNNDYETYHALKYAGAEPDIIHINELASGKKVLDDYSLMVIPGGFSYGDDLGAGKVFSLFLEHRVCEDIGRFIDKGKMVLGICNGFQVLVKSKIIPDSTGQQKATLTYNESGRFICRWVRLRVNADQIWFKGMPDVIELPIAHAEGRFIVAPEFREELIASNCVSMRYESNPNGSWNSIAGITNSQGNVLGMMPHPDRFFYARQYPGTSKKNIVPWGGIIFKNMVDHA